MTERTIEVEGFFGKPRQRSREEFVGIWRGQAEDFYKLHPSASYEAVTEIINKVEGWAEAEFDRLYALQNR